MPVAYVALGANLGEPVRALKGALRAMSEAGIELLACSSFYRTEPIDSSGPDYVNAVAKVSTNLSADDLLRRLLAIEKEFGRIRPAGVHNAPRTLDLDLLLYEENVLQTPLLTLPHPRMHERAFVLVPLAEISPEAVIPGKGRVKDLLPGVTDQRIEKMA